MSEAQRYPDDYDGIIAGAPANNRIRQTFGFVASWIATHNVDGSPILTAAKLALVTKAAVAACDANDTLEGRRDRGSAQVHVRCRDTRL